MALGIRGGGVMDSISLYKILYDWRYETPLTEEESELRKWYYNKFRNFVAATARGKRRERILQKPWYVLNICGIFDRLRINRTTEQVEYTAGQDYISEMGILRDCFD